MALFSKKQKPAENDVKITEKRTETGLRESALSPRLRSASGGQARKSASLLKQAWITEKAGAMSGDRKYMFIVANHANKSEVKKAVQSVYGVKVQDVNMIVRKGKTKRLGRSAGRTPDYKKAMVTLKEGQKIESLTP